MDEKKVGKNRQNKNVINEIKESKPKEELEEKQEILSEDTLQEESKSDLKNKQKNAKKDSSKESSTRRLQNVAATAVGGYFGGAKGAEAGNAISKSKAGSTLASTLEKSKTVNIVAKEAEESGTLDATEGVIEGALSLKNMDVKGVVENTGKAVKGTAKVAKKTLIRFMLPSIIAIFFLFIIFFIIAAPVLQGYMQLSDMFKWPTPTENFEYNEEEENNGNIGGGGANTGNPGYDPYDGYVPEISTDERESLSKSTKSEKLNYLFPNGIPTTQAEMAKYLTTITVNIINESGNHSTKSLTVHKKLAANFKGAFEDLYKAGFKIKSGTTGAYTWKNVSGTKTLSQHSYGAAVDINWNDNPVCNTKTTPCGKYNPGVNEYSITKSVANILERHGLHWGLWTGNSYPNGVKYDYMHFSYTGG